MLFFTHQNLYDFLVGFRRIFENCGVFKCTRKFREFLYDMKFGSSIINKSMMNYPLYIVQARCKRTCVYVANVRIYLVNARICVESVRFYVGKYVFTCS